MSEQSDGRPMVKDRGMGAGETENEGGYLDGRRRAWMNMLSHAAKELGYDDQLAKAAAHIVEREETVKALRDVCEEHGDNEWSDDLHLGDVVEKHLRGYLGDASEETAQEDALSLAAAVERMRAEFGDGSLDVEMSDMRRRFGYATAYGIETRRELEVVLITLGIEPSMGAWQRVFSPEASGPVFDVEAALVRLRADCVTQGKKDRIAGAVKLGIRDERDFTMLLLGLGYTETMNAWGRIMGREIDSGARS